LSDRFASIFGRIRQSFMGGVDSAAETQFLYGFLSELFPKPLPRKGMETSKFRTLTLGNLGLLS